MKITKRQLVKLIKEQYSSHSSECENFVKKFKSNRKVNFATFENVLIPLAEEIDAYTGNTMGDLQYSKKSN